MARIRLTPPRRCTRRTIASRSRPPAGPAPDGARDDAHARRAGRALLAPPPACGLRPLILILDVSGSMSDYSRNLLQFAYSTRRAASRVEVFCFGTRLDPDHQGTRAAPAPTTRSTRRRRRSFDWEGGTRIGDSLDAFVRGWGRRGMSRGAIVVICSDGLDRGDPAVLAGAMERLGAPQPPGRLDEPPQGRRPPTSGRARSG